MPAIVAVPVMLKLVAFESVPRHGPGLERRIHEEEDSAMRFYPWRTTPLIVWLSAVCSVPAICGQQGQSAAGATATDSFA